MELIREVGGCCIQRPKFMFGGVALVGFILALCLSIASLEYTEIGLNYSFFGSSVEHRGYAAGIYFLGFGNSFLRFPSIVKSIQFSGEQGSSGPDLRSRTNDGLEVALEISFQYQLNTSSIFDLYEKFGVDYEPIFVTMAIDLLTAQATSYSATAFFSDRQAISLAMEDELKDHFGVNAFASIPFFQLRAVSLPADFEHAIQATEVAKQDIQTAHAEFGNQEVQMMTQVLQAQQQALAMALQANATAESILLNMEAFVKQFILTQSLQAKSLTPLLAKIGNNETLLLDYMQTRAMRGHPDHLVAVNMHSVL